MKKIFKKAHKMTREMVEKYGVDYQAQLGLNLSYLLEGEEEEEMEFIKKEEVRDFKDGMLTLTTSNRQSAWVAEITGTDPKYEFSRKFIKEPTINGGRWVSYALEEGKTYNWNEAKKQYFGIVENGKLFEISKTDVKNILAE